VCRPCAWGVSLGDLRFSGGSFRGTLGRSPLERCALSELGRVGVSDGGVVAIVAMVNAIGGTVPGVLPRVRHVCHRGAARTVAEAVGVMDVCGTGTSTLTIFPVCS
jgi:hypothetical protein